MKYKEIGLHQQALEVAEILEPPEKVRVLVAVAVKDAEQSQYDQAIENIKSIADQMPSKEWGYYYQFQSDKRNGLSQIAIKAAQVGQYEQVFKVIESIDDFCEDCIAKPLIKLVNKATRTETKDKASQLLDKALSVAQFTVLDESERVEVLAEIANHYAQLGHQQQASDILAQALKTGEDIPIAKWMPENMSLTYSWFKSPCSSVR